MKAKLVKAAALGFDNGGTESCCLCNQLKAFSRTVMWFIVTFDTVAKYLEHVYFASPLTFMCCQEMLYGFAHNR
jgi:hypothetical protein